MRRYIIPLITLGALSLIILTLWTLKVSKDMKRSLEDGWFAKPVEVYSRSQDLRANQKIDAQNLIKIFKKNGWTKRQLNQSILEKEFAFLPREDCAQRLNTRLPEEATNCLIFKGSSSDLSSPNPRTSQQGLIILSSQKILEILILKGNEMVSHKSLNIGAKLFVQFMDGEAVRQRFTPLSLFPEKCLQSILAIEDDKFLEHKGVSLTSIIRAFIRNLIKQRLVEGGSTITQQLIKNKFLSHKKSYIRKAKEAIMAIAIELTTDKNKILESYINLVYMGQDGPFQVRGFPAASRFYFDKEISELNLRECASLAGSLKGPGIYGPHKEKNKNRTTAVLKRLGDLRWITESELLSAKVQKLEVFSSRNSSFLAPYFIDAVKTFLKNKKINTEQGLQVFTTLSPEHQKIAERVAKKRMKKLKKEIQPSKYLENMIVSANPKTGEVLALVGGSNFKTSPYNRVLNNFRPIGSLMKPFVYLSALNEDEELTPTSLISNEKYTYKDHLKEWTPENYTKGSFGGRVYFFQALMSSLNVPSARVGLEYTHPKKIIDLISLLGINHRLKPYPALILGTFEFYPLEVLHLYSVLSQMGQSQNIHYIKKVINFNKEVLYQFDPDSPSSQEYFAEHSQKIENMAIVIGMLKNTLRFGTARASKYWNLKGHYAGKTGTTSFHKDSWFAGFSKDHVAISWVGYDQGTGHNLTGAGHALPLWLDYIRSLESKGFIPDDFDWPEKVKIQTFSGPQLNKEAEDLFAPLPEEEIELVVKDLGFWH